MQGSSKVSILQGDRRYCYLTGAVGNLHKHHIYYGTGLRKISDKHGFWVLLTPELHNMSENGVHGKNGHELDLKLKQDCQRVFEQEHTREEFMQIIGKNYL